MSQSTPKYNRTLTGLLRERLESIEARLEFGERQDVIVAELCTEGYKTTLASFRNLLAKARKWRDEKQAKSLREPVKNRPTTDRQGKDIPKPVNAPKTGNIRNPGKIDKSELF